jgi:diguanylate cyclase (GGDEF)-like protein
VLAEQLPLEMALLHRDLLRLGPGLLQSLHGIAVFMIDLDRFKSVNDRWGHEVGDTVLQAVATRLQTAVREVDLVVRWGGEEFVVLARGVDRDGLLSLGHRLLHHVAASAIEVPGHPSLPITASVGFVPYPLSARPPDDELRWPDLLDAADRLMYLAKERGRARACGVVWRDDTLANEAPADVLHAILEHPTRPIAGLEPVEVALGELVDDEAGG